MVIIIIINKYNLNNYLNINNEKKKKNSKKII